MPRIPLPKPFLAWMNSDCDHQAVCFSDHCPHGNWGIYVMGEPVVCFQY